MQTTDRLIVTGSPRASTRGRDLDRSMDFSADDAPTFPPLEHELEARPARKSSATVDRGERTQRLGARVAVYDEPAPDDWMLVAVGLGMSSSMLGLLVMLFSGYGAV